MKRLFDMVFSVIALSLFAIPMGMVALLLRFKERHPVLFKQQRIGKDGIVFEILKFQTMIDGAPTRTGRVLRKTGLDELPQFFNVLAGDMSIVGPRALTLSDIKRLGWDGEFFNTRWTLKPGITGFAQIYGGQHKKISWFWDRHYIKANNPAVDFIIIMISFMMNIFGKTRVRRMVFGRSGLK
jgi:lipopolysaccharide/colanic/teichoic acid biosynthesis glycosyltransferase